MAKKRTNEKVEDRSHELPDDLDMSKQELNISIVVKAISEEECSNQIKCKLYCTEGFAVNAIMNWLEDDEDMLGLFRDSISKILIKKLMGDIKEAPLMGKGGDA